MFDRFVKTVADLRVAALMTSNFDKSASFCKVEKEPESLLLHVSKTHL